MKKSELRREFLARRSTLTPLQIAAMSRDIAERFFSEIDLRTVGTLHTFIRIPKFNEIDTSNIYYQIWRDHPDITTCAPRTDSVTGELESIVFDASTPFEENSWGIREPASNETVDPEEIDLVIVPMLCFDADGHRVGYGKGYYDKFLSGCRSDCLKVGICLFGPVDSIDDIHDGDIPIDICITPDRNFRFSGPNEYLN